MASVWGELKRRNVVRVAIAYAVVAWLLLQVADVVLDNIDAPAWVFQAILLLLVIGFPVALIFAWAFELTPQGIKKEQDVDRAESVTHITGRKLDFIIMGILSVALVMFALDKYVWTVDIAPTDGDQRAIAVLPFVNMSSDPEQEYFSDGLAEELLNMLARIPELRVTSRTSAFSYKGKDVKISDIGRELNVDHVLEGSVRRSGDTIRISAQLIEVSSDAPLWSDNWERSFDDIFVIQDEIADSVVGALRISLIGDMPHAQETSPKAYALYLQSRFIMSGHNAPAYLQAEPLIKRALEIDSEYAPAWARLADIYISGAGYGIWSPVDAAEMARTAAVTALNFDPESAEAHSMLSQIALQFDYDVETAITEQNTALRLAPGNSRVLESASDLAFYVGEFEEAIRLRKEAHDLDPLSEINSRGSAALAYFFAGHHEEAMALYREAVAAYPDGMRKHSNLGRAMLILGDYQGALIQIDKEVSEGHRLTGRALVFQAMGNTEQSATELTKLLALGNRWTYEISEVYAFRGELDEAFLWLDRAVERRDPSLFLIVVDPFLDNLRDDPRFNLVLDRLGRKPR